MSGPKKATPREHSTSVGGKNYVLHIPLGEKTACGRLKSTVNCTAGDSSQWSLDELCRSCAKKVGRTS